MVGRNVEIPNSQQLQFAYYNYESEFTDRFFAKSFEFRQSLAIQERVARTSSSTAQIQCVAHNCHVLAVTGKYQGEIEESNND